MLIDKKFHKEDKTIFFEPDFTEHWTFVQQMSDKREYYDVRKIKYSFRNEVLWVAIREYLGNRSYLLITSVLERIRNLYSNIFKNNGKDKNNIQRNSNIELLRIVCMLFIIGGHIIKFGFKMDYDHLLPFGGFDYIVQHILYGIL